MRLFLYVILALTSFALHAALPQSEPQVVPIDEIENFENYPAKVKQLIYDAKALSEKGLHYQYGSADPRQGGMDCSGTVYYLLQALHIDDVPRATDELYLWAVKNGNFHKVTNQTFDSPEFADLQPGDLLFWTGTYPVKRASPLSHVMIYLGKNKSGERIMFGASDGRTYQGKQIWGVSVFDFKLPAKTSTSRFIGYSCTPHINCPDKPE